MAAPYIAKQYFRFWQNNILKEFEKGQVVDMDDAVIDQLGIRYLLEGEPDFDKPEGVEQALGMPGA